MTRNAVSAKAAPTPRGRPFNHQASDALLEAARSLVVEQGYARVTMQQIAERAGVGRQTVYRRWSNKADLVLHALLKYSQARIRVEDGPLAQRVERYFVQMFADINALHGPLLRSLMAAAQDDDDFRRSFEAEMARPRDRLLRDMLQLGVERGELPADASLGTRVEMAHGALWYRMQLGRPLTRRFAAELAAVVVPARQATASRK